MPEYLAPGVYPEETSFRNKSIEGVSTSTAAFVGPTRFGPMSGAPELLTSFADFERIYGGLDALDFAGTASTNYLAHAVRAFFEEGGKRLYVSRVYTAPEGSDGRATANVPKAAAEKKRLSFSARWPGKAGSMTVTFAFKLGPNAIGRKPVDPAAAVVTYKAALQGVAPYEVVLGRKVDEAEFYVAVPVDSEPGTLKFVRSDGTTEKTVAQLYGDVAQAKGDYEVLPVSLNVTVVMPGKNAQVMTFQDVKLDARQDRALAKVFALAPESRATELYVPLAVKVGSDLSNGAAVADVLAGLDALTPGTKTIKELLKGTPGESDLTSFIVLSNGSDGARPAPAAYAGAETKSGDTIVTSGLRALEDVEDISIVAAPGSTAGLTDQQMQQVTLLLISHCERLRYRIAVLDTKQGLTLSEVQAWRGQFDSKYAAMYYPWLRVIDPLTGQPLLVPPSGFVTGIYARNDVENGVHKAPANEVVHCTGLELMLNKAQQDVLNPLGINCFRYFEGRGFRLWGARTISSDPEWKYVNVRRYFNYLERSIDKGTQWSVFMNNSDPLWANVRSTIEDFLFNEWKSGALMGATPAEAYFVRCDRSTMTQNDIDNGRLICLVGVAPVKPAEFVIIRIGQWTANRQG